MSPIAPKSICVADMVNLMERLAPPDLAESWDNCGIQVGDPKWPVKKVWVALDPLYPVIAAAASRHIDLVITHHPLIFKPLKKIDLETIEGRIIATALDAHTAIYSAHTNLDCAREGINDMLARKIGLIYLSSLVPANEKHCGQEGVGDDGRPLGIGRLGLLEAPLTVVQLVEKIKVQLGLAKVMVAGRMDRSVQKIAVCSGSGGSLLPNFLATDADVYISGDLRYHDARSAEAAGRTLIDVGHFASERIFVEPLCRQLEQAAAASGWDVRISACQMEQDPFEII